MIHPFKNTLMNKQPKNAVQMFRGGQSGQPVLPQNNVAALQNALGTTQAPGATATNVRRPSPERTPKEIMNRQLAPVRQSLSRKMEAYKQENAGAKPTTPTTPANPSTPAPTPAPAPAAPTGPANMQAPTQNGIGRWNSNQSIPDYLGMTPEMIQKAMGMATGSAGNQYYDPTKDPVYQSMFQLSQNQSKQATKNAMETMNERGILNSTVMSDRAGQINQSASDAVLGSIPGLAANYDNKQMANMQAIQNLIGTVMQGGQFQQTFAEDNRRFDKDFALDEAQVTGRYFSPESNNALQQILQAKQMQESSTATAAQKQQAASQAQAARMALAGAGVEMSGVGDGYSLEESMRNAYYMGRDSLPQQAMDLERAAVTGVYQPTSAQGLIQRVLEAKAYAENPNLTAEQKKNSTAHTRANEARQILTSMGLDASALGGDVTLQKAMQNIQNGRVGSQTLANQQFQAENAFAQAQLTGNYLPPQSQGLVTELLNLKKLAEGKKLGASEKKGVQRRASEIRNILNGQGVNADQLFGSNVSYKQAAQNVAKMGTATLDAKQQAFNNALARDQFNFDTAAFDREMDFTEGSFDREMNFTEDSFNKELDFNRYSFDREMNFTEGSFDREMDFTEGSFDREMNFTEQQAKIEADLASRGLDLEEVALGIDKYLAESDVSYKQDLMDLDINDQTAQQNTNAAIGQALKSKSGADALAFVSEASAGWAEKGVDIRSVLESVYARWPEAQAVEGTTSFGGTP